MSASEWAVVISGVAAVIALLSLVLAGVSTWWSVRMSMRYADVHWSLAPAPSVTYADGAPRVAMVLTNEGTNLARDVRVRFVVDPFNVRVKASPLWWHDVPARRGVVMETDFRYPSEASSLSTFPWNEEVAGAEDLARRDVVVSWVNPVGWKRSEVLHAPMAPYAPPAAA